MPKTRRSKIHFDNWFWPYYYRSGMRVRLFGSQALRSLREDGIETILINSNPATIMTDPCNGGPCLP